jgi:hypothetical protein
MMISGHKTRSVFDRYNIVSEDDLKEAARRSNERCSVKIRATELNLEWTQLGHTLGLNS